MSVRPRDPEGAGGVFVSERFATRLGALCRPRPRMFPSCRQFAQMAMKPGDFVLSIRYNSATLLSMWVHGRSSDPY
jgi:hypothetical protein